MTSRIHEGMRLSPLRVVIAAAVLAGLAAGGVVGYQSWASAQAEPSQDPWFAGYADVTATPTFAFESADTGSATTPTDTAKTDQVVLSFIVTGPDDVCSPSWGGYYTPEQANEELELDRRIALLRERGGDIAISFGGQRGQELATTCEYVDQLATAYRSVIDRYSVSTIDLDLEGAGLADAAANERRAAAIAQLQAEDEDGLAVWVTLPASPTGLSEDGTNAVSALLSAGVDLAGVNVMTMDFGDSRDATQTMAETSVQALEATHQQLKTLYQLADIPLSDATVWTKLGATPMIGQNDVKDEVFGLQDAADLNEFAREKGLGRMSMWSLNRDRMCGSNYTTLSVVSNSCSGIDQGDSHFSTTLAAGFSGSIVGSASRVTTSEPVDPADLVDDPAKSPYPIWSKTSTYLEGTKIVWHHNVYQAKWWTVGDLPDNPVLNAWETPWELLGPVLPGEKPIDTRVLTPGMFPEWDGTAIYEKGTIVTFEDVPYRAKWWTQGDSPEAQSSNPDDSPWVPLTQDEVDELVAAQGDGSGTTAGN